MDFRELPDRELFRFCAEGRSEAWDFFVDKFSKLVYNAIHTTMKLYASDFLLQDVEDIYGQVFIALLDDNCRRLRQFRGDRDGSAASWLSIVAMNMTRNYIFRTKADMPLDDDHDEGKSMLDSLQSPRPSADAELSDAQERHILKTLIKQLRTQERLILQYHLDGVSSREIARIVGRTQNAVDSLLSRIRKKLKDILDSL